MSTPPLLLFICAGNICRSPMAQVIAEDEARRRGLNVRAASAGLAALEGNAATEQTQAVIEELGLSLREHRAQGLTHALFTDAALVVTATRRQRDELRRFFPNDATRIVSFDDVTKLGDLADPYGGDAEAFRRTAAVLKRGMPMILAALISQAHGAGGENQPTSAP
jgi:protein-tyrosine-phosphatase